MACARQIHARTRIWTAQIWCWPLCVQARKWYSAHYNPCWQCTFCGPSKSLVEKIKAAFMKKWKCWDLGEPCKFLWMNIHWEGHCIYIDQRNYLNKVLEHCRMINAKPASTPLPQEYYPEKNDAPVKPEMRTHFQMVIVSLLHLMIGTWPDISYTVTQLAWQSANPSKEHLEKALYICQYLLGTANYLLVYDSDSGKGTITCIDSDWGQDKITGHSQTGFYLKLANGVFLWNSHLQKTTALSSTEAEYMALSNCSHQAIWIKQMFEEIGYNLSPIPICVDNQGSLFIVQNPVTEQRSKHIHIKYLLQFVSSRMVSSCFPSYVVLIYSLVCVPTIGLIAWSSWVRLTPLLLNSNPMPFLFYYYRTGSCLVTHLCLPLSMDSLIFYPILSYRIRVLHYSSDSLLFYGVLCLCIP